MEFQISYFDRTKISLIKRLLNYFRKEFSYISIRTWDEMSGFYEDKTFQDLENDLVKMDKEYTGLDQIEVYNENNEMILNIIFHEDLFWINIDEKEKSNIEKNLNVKLRPFKK